MPPHPNQLGEFRSHLASPDIKLEGLGLAMGLVRLLHELEGGIVWPANSQVMQAQWRTDLAHADACVNLAAGSPPRDNYNVPIWNKAIGISPTIFDRLIALANAHWRAPVSGPVRPLPGIVNSDLRAIAERDLGTMQEARRLGFVKVVVILAGSVVEAVLLDLLEQDPSATLAARGSVNSARSGTPGWSPAGTNYKKWKLYQVIAACGPDGLGALTPPKRSLTARTEAAADLVRGTRNFVHPEVERSDPPLSEADAALSEALVDLVLADLGL